MAGKSGYAGGQVPNPTYRQVCNGTTGHAEVVQITFDPQAVSFRQLLEVFFTIHDPTTPNRQGADVGTQYRSAIFYHSPEQKAAAEQVIAEINQAGIWDGPVVTELAPAFADVLPRRVTTRVLCEQQQPALLPRGGGPRLPSCASTSSSSSRSSRGSIQASAVSDSSHLVARSARAPQRRRNEGTARKPALCLLQQCPSRSKYRQAFLCLRLP